MKEDSKSSSPPILEKSSPLSSNSEKSMQRRRSSSLSKIFSKENKISPTCKSSPDLSEDKSLLTYFKKKSKSLEQIITGAPPKALTFIPKEKNINIFRKLLTKKRLQYAFVISGVQYDNVLAIYLLKKYYTHVVVLLDCYQNLSLLKSELKQLIPGITILLGVDTLYPISIVEGVGIINKINSHDRKLSITDGKDIEPNKNTKKYILNMLQNHDVDLFIFASPIGLIRCLDNKTYILLKNIKKAYMAGGVESILNSVDDDKKKHSPTTLNWSLNINSIITFLSLWKRYSQTELIICSTEFTKSIQGDNNLRSAILSRNPITKSHLLYNLTNYLSKQSGRVYQLVSNTECVIKIKKLYDWPEFKYDISCILTVLTSFNQSLIGKTVYIENISSDSKNMFRSSYTDPYNIKISKSITKDIVYVYSGNTGVFSTLTI